LGNKPRFTVGGVDTPFREDGLDGVGVSWELDRDGERDPRAGSGVGAEREELETSADEALPLDWRCAMGNKGSGCLRFRRGSLKNVVVVWTVWVVVVVLPYTLSPELASDREDSESRLTGSASVEEWSSP
jgi:hypothetical protein